MINVKLCIPVVKESTPEAVKNTLLHWHLVKGERNILMFGSTKRTECLEQASAEVSVTTSSIASRLVMQIEPMKREQEAYSLKGVGSSQSRSLNE